MKKMTKRIALALLCLWLLPFQAFAAQELVPVGQVVGLELQDGSVTVAAFDEELGAQSRAAGLRVGDVIESIDGHRISSSEDIRSALARSHGVVDVQISREGKKQKISLTPYITTNGPKLGVYLKQGITGIGTVTWYDPDTGEFATLGHGVNNSRGKLLDMTQGNAYDARVLTVRKGKSGEPGQLMGAVERLEPVGTLTANTARGVFGTSPEGWEGEEFPVARTEEIRTGKATILSTVSGVEPREYSVEILKIYPKSRQTGRNLLIHVTDPALLEATGGIVQGMGVSYNRDNPEKPLACRVIWGWSQFLLDFANYRIPCAGMLGHYHSMPLIKAEDEIYEGGLSTRHFNTTSNFPFSCHTG